MASYRMKIIGDMRGITTCELSPVQTTDDLRQRFLLIFSNAAAILPSAWALRHKVYSEWVIVTLSGIANAIYHSCDAGGWCAMSYSTLQVPMAFLSDDYEQNHWMSYETSQETLCVQLVAYLHLHFSVYPLVLNQVCNGAFSKIDDLEGYQYMSMTQGHDEGLANSHEALVAE